jgi:hypothetical protein
MGCVLIGPVVGVDLLLGILNTASRSVTIDMEGGPFEPPFFLRWRLLTEVSATVFATEPSSRLTNEAIAPGIPVIVTVAVIVGI